MKTKVIAIRLLISALLCLSLTITVLAGPGDLDPSFGNAGKVIDDSTYDLYDVAIQADGKIVTVGTAGGSFLVARYNVDGSADATFGDNGRVVTSFGSDQSGGTAIAIQGDGKIVASGWKCECFDWGAEAFVVIRYNPDGSLDTSFDGDGKVTTKVGLWPTAYSVVIQPDNKIVVGGFTWWGDGTYANDSFALARYNADGSLDTSFDGDGKVVTEICSVCNDDLESMALQPDGKIIAIGGSFSFDSPAQPDVIRYNTNGSIDTTFSFNISSLGPIDSRGYFTSVATKADGKILVANSGWTNPPVLSRLNSDGSLDTTFDSDGKVTTSLGDSQIAIQPNSKILVAGTFYNSAGQDFKLIRYGLDGSLDTSFGGGDGETIVDFGGTRDLVDGIALDPMGRVVVVGRLFEGNVAKGVGIARFQLDSRLSVSGRITAPNGQGLRNAIVSITDPLGTRHSANTSTLGYYSIPDIPPGSTYSIEVSSRRYRFTPRTIAVQNDLTDIDFTGLE